MEKRKSKNSFGVKILKFLLIVIIGLAIFSFILPPLFSIMAPFLQILPFDVPNNFIFTDYVGLTVLGLSLVMLLFYAIKWGFR